MNGFRTVIIKSRCKVSLELGYILVRGEEDLKIHLSEVSLFIIQSTGVAVTAALLVELTKRNIKVIFCDEKANPCFENAPYANGYNTSARLKEQISWTEECKQLVWTRIIKEKIRNQQINLLSNGHQDSAEQLGEYIDEMLLGDENNREGHAAKVYFNSLFGNDFSRRSDNDINGALNYGYAILLSAINREIVADGYLTQLGIWHDNNFNQFNLSCDLMEPFRPWIDDIVFKIDNKKEFKKELSGILNMIVLFNGEETHFDNAIAHYCHTFFDAMKSKKANLVMFPSKK